jgi:hypothetical protein
MPGGFPFIGDICNANDVGTVGASTNGTSVVGGGSNGVKGSWTQLTASSPCDSVMVLLSIQYDSALDAGNYFTGLAVDIAVGGSGNEVIVINNAVMFFAYYNPQCIYALLPLNIPAGSRISARCADAYGGTATATVQLTLFDGSFEAGEGLAGYDSVGFDPTTCVGTALFDPGSNNTKGSWTELVAATSRDYIGFRPIVNYRLGGSRCYMLDIAIGSSGNEKIIVPNLLYHGDSGAMFQGFLPIQIPAGTRISARIQTDLTTTDQTWVMLLAGYK